MGDSERNDFYFGNLDPFRMAANSELQTRFSPQISSLAGKLLAKLTGARYDTVLLGSSMQAETRETGELVTRQLLYLSGGTADQV